MKCERCGCDDPDVMCLGQTWAGVPEPQYTKHWRHTNESECIAAIQRARADVPDLAADLQDARRRIQVAVDCLFALVPNPKEPDFSKALSNGNPADNAELKAALSALIGAGK